MEGKGGVPTGAASGQEWVGAGWRTLLAGQAPLTPRASGLTTAKLTQAVASCVSVASSSWSCIFFSSFLEGMNGGR